MEETTDIQIGGVTLIVSYTYEKEEDSTWFYIGSAAEVTIETIFIEDSLIDLYELLETSSYKFIVELEDIIIEKHQNR
tara:strand:+ start:252 stop:485 length:234 start_codon:yes stop_codon:yes gene_type:complete